MATLLTVPYDFEAEFEYGYCSPGLRKCNEGMSLKSSAVWSYAVEKTYKEFGNDGYLAALIGIACRFHEPKTIADFEQILKEHAFWVRARASRQENDINGKLWSPAEVTAYLDNYNTTYGIEEGRHYYVKKPPPSKERFYEPGDWRIMMVAATMSAGKRTHYRQCGVGNGNIPKCRFYGDQGGLFGARFSCSSAASLPQQAFHRLRNFLIPFFSKLLPERDAATIIPKINILELAPFECALQSAKITFSYEVSRPYWTEPDQISMSLMVEKIAR